MGGMYHLRVILLKKLEGMAPVPYPIQNRVNVVDAFCFYRSLIHEKVVFSMNHLLKIFSVLCGFLSVFIPCLLVMTNKTEQVSKHISPWIEDLKNIKLRKSFKLKINYTLKYIIEIKLSRY